MSTHKWPVFVGRQPEWCISVNAKVYQDIKLDLSNWLSTLYACVDFYCSDMPYKAYQEINFTDIFATFSHTHSHTRSELSETHLKLDTTIFSEAFVTIRPDCVLRLAFAKRAFGSDRRRKLIPRDTDAGFCPKYDTQNSTQHKTTPSRAPNRAREYNV